MVHIHANTLVQDLPEKKKLTNIGKVIGWVVKFVNQYKMSPDFGKPTIYTQGK